MPHHRNAIARHSETGNRKTLRATCALLDAQIRSSVWNLRIVLCENRNRFSGRRAGRRAIAGLAAAVISLAPNLALAQTCAMNLRGINLAGAEFGTVGQAYGDGYIYPSKETIQIFADRKFNTIRLPFLWERLQPTLDGPLDTTELGRIQAVVKAARNNDMIVVLDPHNYARYNGQLIGSDAVPASAFAGFWRRLSSVFANDSDVIFGLMNEPHDIASTDWLAAANAAIAAIRDIGAGNLILVPGTAWTGAHSWEQNYYGPSNGTVMKGVVDSISNFAFEVHQYADTDFSGKAENCDQTNAAVAALTDFTAWLKANNFKGFLGEFGTISDLSCLVGLKKMVDTVDNNPGQWIGWAYWASGDWWQKGSPMIIQPDTRDGGGQQLRTLEPALGPPANPRCQS